MRNENSLKARVQRDAEFFKHLLADVPARQVLAMAQQKYPEASMYEERRAHLFCSQYGWLVPLGGAGRRAGHVPHRIYPQQGG